MNDTRDASPIPEPAKDPGARPSSGNDLGFELPAPTKLSRGRALVFVGIALALLGAIFLFAYLPRRAAKAALEEDAKAATSALPVVSVLPPKLVASERVLRLPATIQPLEEAVIYARANGYVKRWLVDLGDHVKEGQLLAEIDTPELGQELALGRAALAKARALQAQEEANRTLAKSKLARTGKLVEAGVGTQQELEQTEAESEVGDANVHVAQASVRSEQANLKRLGEVLDLAKVEAPFDGVVMARSIDRGSLVTAGNQTPMFRLASVDPVRIFVQVPQDSASSIQTSQAVKLSVREQPGRVFEGLVTRTAGALDPQTRTLNTEIRVANGDGSLLAGTYAEASIALSSPRQVFELPATALLSDARGLQVAVVLPNDTLKLTPVTIDRDLGATLYIASGLKADDRVVQIARIDLKTGDRVRAAPGKPVASPAAASGSASTPPAAPAGSAGR